MEDESDSDSSIDEIENQRLKEATLYVETFVKDTKRNEAEKQGNRKPPSLRASSPVSESNPLNTTPEFREFVAKKLSELLDKSIKARSGEDTRKIEYSEQDTGIKLFTSSTTVIQDAGDEAATAIKQRPPSVRRRKLSSSTDSSDEESRLAEAAISVEQIMKDSKTPHNGTLEKIEKQKEIATMNNSGSAENSGKKRKKKNKKMKSELKVS
ncbi:protein CUSTOS-like isoform X1 [Ostrea edulis]|uniref:protein CUSTOS-like isoform X1 n=1 Tax=Ostrea edulis TaxID=37623 RepID=UPI0024AFA301|nr:protein CUSTOS-like isoform X1 [Ostrea edulis]